VISISQHLARLNDESTVRNTILHEIAHALMGHEAGHGPKWRAKAREIGRDGERCYASTVSKPEPPLVYACPECGLTIRRHRRFSKRIACGRCCKRYSGGAFDPRFVFELRRISRGQW
jgi:predicted SprT family Zn-dependent metalloprotease